VIETYFLARVHVPGTYAVPYTDDADAGTDDDDAGPCEDIIVLVFTECGDLEALCIGIAWGVIFLSQRMNTKSS